MAINKTRLTVIVDNIKIISSLKYDLLITYKRLKSGRLPEKIITIKPAIDAVFTASKNGAVTREHKIAVTNIIKVVFLIKINNEAVKNFDVTDDVLKGRPSSWKLPTTHASSLKDINNEKRIKIKTKKYIVWTGTYFEVSTGRKIIDTKLYEFKLTSECVSGTKYTVDVRATAEVFVTDISIFGDSSVGQGEVKFYQKADTPLDPKVFNGDFALGAISGSFGYTVMGPLAMGQTLGDNSGPGASSDLIAIEMGRGTAKVTDYTKESCN
ncbi:hypothetical protein ACS8E2_07825 [Psychrobacter glaciei]|uniref:hypothetical protein n=1 Tax=Psychrobacter TaxID=497 RepID=UPI003F477A84